MSGADKRGRYTSKSQGVARTAAQHLLLKPFVWRILNVNVHGVENLSNVDGAFIAVANHASHLDTPLIFGSLPRRLSKNLATGAAADFFFDKWWKAAPTALFFNAFPVERRGAGARKGLAGTLLSDGVPLLIYPEGTRSRNGAMGPFTPGTAALCISRNVPCIPIALVGCYAAWPSNQNSLPSGRPPVHVVFGHPMLPAPGEIAHKFQERVRRKVIELHDSTARAYGMKTLAEYARNAAIEKSAAAQAKNGQSKEQA